MPPPRPCHVFEGFPPPYRVRPIGRTISKSCHFLRQMIRQGMHRLTPSSTKSAYFIYFQNLVVVKFLISAKFGQKMTLKSPFI